MHALPPNTKHEPSNKHDIQDSTEITLVSYTEPADEVDDDLAEYLVGKVIEKSKVPVNKDSFVEQAPYVDYRFKKIESDEEKRKDSQINWHKNDPLL